MQVLKKLVEWFEKHKKISSAILIIILGIMTYFSSIPGSTIISFGSIWPSIIYHFTIFAGFAFFFTAIIIKKKLEKKTILTTIFVSLLVSILDEIHQLFVPLRSAGIQDVLTDLTGVFVSMGLYWLIKRAK